MKNALNNQVGMLGDMFLWLVANLKQGVIYFIKQALPPNKSAGSVVSCHLGNLQATDTKKIEITTVVLKSTNPHLFINVFWTFLKIILST